MTQRHKSAQHHSQNSLRCYPYAKLLHICASTLPAQGFFLLTSVSLLGGGLAIAQTETSIDNIVPTNESYSVRAVVIPNTLEKETVSSAPSQPESSVPQEQADLIQKLRTRQQVSTPRANVTWEEPKAEVSTPRANVTWEEPKTEVSTPRANVTWEEPKTEVAQPTTPQGLPEKLLELAQPSNNSDRPTGATAGKTTDYNNAYIDPTSYTTKTTATYQAPNSVVLTERSSGCQTVLPSGQSISGSSCAAPNREAARHQKTAPSWVKTSQNIDLAQVRVLNNHSSNRWVPSHSANSANSANKTASPSHRFSPNPITSVLGSAIVPSGETLPPPMAAGNIAPRPSTVAYEFPLASVLPQIPFTGSVAYGHGGMIFPLSIPARISSVFGWRNHPITGDIRFHSGTDLAAPMGTPVVAAAAGTVETANWLGGYGLSVIINHASAQQTLYAHMSELFVQPGQTVEQGTVIGRVGSTGNSTGNHLHFEVRHLKPQGWVAVDSGVQLEIAFNQLVQALQTARVPEE
ncbi:M23 family metallopeptidase [Anabaenopsis tanganyikae CS-531]|uniref:M23 family metallopeptidase n=1 Tax=Anabaenopsis tanganyikae CS-531 TaxID=2785304 RepID=A0ABT6KIV6_9CYAN|nr:M23 family metallopeptidase [Anabaenopsis tanganyikae]MDH6107465.1 M23 family metallopeptidase [Anabaenopsis tanganyikae CS-531]